MNRIKAVQSVDEMYSLASYVVQNTKDKSRASKTIVCFIVVGNISRDAFTRDFVLNGQRLGAPCADLVMRGENQVLPNLDCITWKTTRFVLTSSSPVQPRTSSGYPPSRSSKYLWPLQVAGKLFQRDRDVMKRTADYADNGPLPFALEAHAVGIMLVGGLPICPKEVIYSLHAGLDSLFWD